MGDVLSSRPATTPAIWPPVNCVGKRHHHAALLGPGASCFTWLGLPPEACIFWMSSWYFRITPRVPSTTVVQADGIRLIKACVRSISAIPGTLSVVSRAFG